MPARHFNCLISFLPALAWLVSASPAGAVSTVVHLHFENFGASGQQPGEADLVGWGVVLTDPGGAQVADLGATQSNGDTLPRDVPAGPYVAVLSLPVPNPYVGAIWPSPLQFPFAIDATNPQGQPITSYRLRIGIGCGCNDGDSCTTDVCTAGVCSTTPNLKPELPELCDRVDNDCDGLTDEGLPVPCNGNPPILVGCADGTREGFMDVTRYPHLAACGGAWDRPGLDGLALAPSCGRLAGNHGGNKTGAGCRASDLCAPGWHICRGPADLAARGGTCADAVDAFYPNFGRGDFGPGAEGQTLAPLPGGAFFLARGVLAQTCVDAVNGLPPVAGGIFGCGNLGLADDRCGGFLRAAGTACGGLRNQSLVASDDPATDWAYDEEGDWAWSCAGAAGTERDAIVKRLGDRQGGVMCCRDAAPGLPEVCDGIDNDADGTTDELPGGRAGDSCPLGAQCGSFECTASGGLACEDPGDCDDTSCNGLDDDRDGETDEEFEAGETRCGVGVCTSIGERTCTAGVENDSCVPAPPAEASDVTCDGLDGDCDGLTDEDWVDVVSTCGLGACISTGMRRCEAGVPTSSCVPRPRLSPTDTTCNDLDEDCNGLVDDGWPASPTSCGEGACAAVGVLACIGGVPSNTCVEGLPLADDATCDGVDDDCDGASDEDAVPTAITCGQGACAVTGTLTCVRGEPVDDCAPLVPTDDLDAACDGIDFDCDGVTDEDFIGMTTTCGVGACVRAGATSCVGGAVIDGCEPGAPGDGDALCDGQDEDCDGATDEDYEPVATTCGEGRCEGNAGMATCIGGVVVDTCDALAGAAAETCDGSDEDCDGLTDEDFGAVGEACDGDDDDLCATGILTCDRDKRAASCIESGPARVELCNGLDDDCDGSTDEGLASCDDSDADGVPDAVDNCVLIANGDQADGDADGLGDACDLLAQGAGGDCSGGAGSGWGLLVGLCAALTVVRRGRAFSV